MTTEQFRASTEYTELMDRIINYKSGFIFKINFHLIPEGKANALRILLRDACAHGILESISIGLGWDENGEFKPLDETYRRK